MLDGTIVVKHKKSVRVRKECHHHIGQGLPESKHALMDVCCTMGGVCVTGQPDYRRTCCGQPQNAAVCES